ncbi:MAG: hypothetical protein ACE5G0_22270 [Rhodothermales bacterium]
MILYLVRTYVGIVLVLAMLMMVGPVIVLGVSPGGVFLSALFWSSLAAAPLTYWDLRRRDLWPLYDNLRLPRFVLLALLAGTVVFILIPLVLWLSR